MGSSKCLDPSIFLSFLRKFEIFLPFYYEIDYVKMNSALKMNILLNIYTYPIAVINIKNSICNTVLKSLVENWDHIIFPSLSNPISICPNP